MRQILVMTSRTPVRSYRLSGWMWRGRTASGTGVFGQFSLAGNPMAALHFATRVFLARNHFSDEQRDKEQEKAQKKRRRNLRSLRRMPTIVLAHTFCASRDNRISYRRC